MSILALVETGRHGIAEVAVATSILTLWCFLLIQRRAFFGKLSVGLEKIREVPFSMALATLCPAALCLVVGLLSPWVTQRLIQPGVASLSQSVGAKNLAMMGR